MVYRSFPFEQLEKFHETIGVEYVMTPCEKFTSLPAQLRVEVARKRILGEEYKDYDQFPVEDTQGKVIGLAFGTDLGNADSGGMVQSVMKGFVQLPPIDDSVPLGKAIGLFGSHHARLVRRSGKVVGLLHKSDFNKTVARAAFYLEIAALEMAIQSLIRKTYAKNEWIRVLDKGRRKSIQRRATSEGSDHLNVDPIEYTYLPDLFAIIARDTSKRLWEGMALSSLEEWRLMTRGLKDFRNRVMHPVRPLVARHRAPDDLNDRHVRVEKLLDNLRAALR